MKSKKLLSLLLAVVMCFITTVPAWADSRAISSDVTAVSMESIDAMTNAQRNAFISQCAAQELGSEILTLINDGAWLSQKIYALSVIQVDICFIDPAL